MAATSYFILQTWLAGKKYPWDERRNVRELLTAAGYAPAKTGDESANLWTALSALFTDSSFAASRLKQNVPALCPRGLASGSPIWLALADAAKILIQLPGKSGIEGVLELNKWFKDNGIKYNTHPANKHASAGDRAIYGFLGNRSYAIQRVKGGWNAGPVEMDCTTYVNLMLSVYLSGDAHTNPYDATTPFGAESNSHCARDRYGFPLVSRSEGGKPLNYFQTAEQISAAAQVGRLYVLEIARAGVGSVTHMALLHDGKVYEYAPEVDLRVSELKDFVKKGLIYYLFGPK